MKKDKEVTFQQLLSKRNVPPFIEKMSKSPEMIKKMTNVMDYAKRK